MSEGRGATRANTYLGAQSYPKATSDDAVVRPSRAGSQVKPGIRQLVSFRQFNLLTDNVSEGPFDIVFLRNVLIYFDEDARKKIIARIRSQMAPHAWLFLGSTESFHDVDGAWSRETHCRATVYRIKSGALV